MEFITVFIIAFIISLLGSIQPGPVNLAVLNSTLQLKTKHAYLIALGGSWPEFFYSIIGFKLAVLVANLPIIISYFKVIMILVFTLLAIYLWFSKTNISLKASHKNGFILGSFLAILNPQLLTFWLTTIVYLKTNQTIPLNTGNFTLLSFSLGAMLGALLFHILLIYLSKKWVGYISAIFLKYADKLVACIFVFLAMFQTIKIYY